MSNATELARREAELVELREQLAELEEHDDPEEADDRERLRGRIAELEGEGDKQAEPPAPVEPERQWPEEPTDEMFEQVRELNRMHAAAVHEVMGPFVEGLEECSTCFGVGLAPPTPTELELEQDPSTATCTVCKGRGKLKTGAAPDAEHERRCENCNGRGWVGPDNLNAMQAAEAAVASVGAPAAAAPAPVAPGEQPAPANEDPRVAALRAEGYVVVKAG